MPVRANSWSELSDKTRRTYAATWGGMDAARERYEGGLPMHRKRPKSGPLAGLSDDLGPGVQSVTVRAVDGGVLAEVVYEPVSHRDGEQVVVKERTAVFFFGSEVDRVPAWMRPMVERVSS